MAARRLLAPLAGLVALMAAPMLTPPAAAQSTPSPLCVSGCGGAGPSPVSVTPTSGQDVVHADGLLDSVTFTVKNSGTTYTDTYTLTFSCSTITCQLAKQGNPNPPGPLTLGPGAATTVYVKFTDPTSLAVSGSVALTAADTSDYRSTGDYALTVYDAPLVTLVAPSANGAGGRAIVHTRQPLVLATYTDTSALDTTSVALTIGGVAVTSLARLNRALLEWEVDTAHALIPGDSTDLALTVCNVHGGCTSVTRRTVLDNTGTPIVSFTGMPLEGQGRLFGAPLGPGLAVSGAEVEAGIAVPAYLARGAAHSTGLVYSTRQSHPRALVNVNLELDWPSGAPSQMKAVLLDGTVRLDSVVVQNTDCVGGGGRHCRIALQGDYAGSTFPTPTRKWLTVEVTVDSASTQKTTDDSVEVVLVDRRATPYGAGWMVSGVLQLVSAGSDKLLVGPTGAASIYRGFDGFYLSPPGDRSVLVWTGTDYELRFRDGSRVVFDSSGNETSVVDRNGNTTTIGYQSAPERVTGITDPTGHGFSFSYASNRLAAITDPGGRHTGFDLDASNDLVADTLPPLPAGARPETFRYTSSGANGAVLLQRRADVLGDATRVAYSARLRPVADSLPAVLPDTGSTLVTPVVAYAAQELRALGTLVSADSLFTQVTDPLGHWTRTALNRWGEGTTTWDSLGTLSRTSYTPDGLAAWTEGKVADSTRVYSTYNALDELVRSFHVRASGDTVRLDSLVYDGSGHVITSFDELGEATHLTYDAPGNVTTVVNPSSDTTRTWYSSTGLVDSVETPDGATRRYAYDSVWGNLEKTTAPDDSTVLADYAFDALGRDTTNLVKLPVQGDSATFAEYQWQRTRRYLDAGNLVDSVEVERTNNCAAPCGSPPAFPNDTLHVVWRRYTYTPLGRDSLALDTRGVATRSATDALGRLVARWPWTDSAAVVDSFRYDLAGNLRFQRTRRDTVIETRYDSRNRRTAMIVPGVGTYEYTYGGPNDELTRAAISGYVDPVGGVNPNVSWVYSQAGLLLADTSQGSFVTAYAADRYGRDTLVTDGTGGWRVRYDAVRGVADTVATPFGDTLTYTFDALGRASGPGISNGGALFSRRQGWSSDGELTLLDNVLNSAGGGLIGDFGALGSDLTGGYLAPGWDVQDTGQERFEVDSVVLDGWNRLEAVAYLTDSTPQSSDSFTFDAMGNLFPAGQSRTYDPVTNRLVLDGAPTANQYDRAGNLTYSKVLGGFDYDALNRLTEAGTSRYAYDVLGRRIAKRVSSGGNAGYVRMIYRGGEVIAEADSAGSVTLAYTWGQGHDDLVAIHDYTGGHDYYVAHDQVGSVRWVGRRDGTWMMSLRYTAYGALEDSAGTLPFVLRYRWLGREYDQESGLYDLRARYYDSGEERFIQEDPGGQATSSNPYAYGEDNPTAGRDLNGLVENEQMYAVPPARYDMEAAFQAAMCSDADAGDACAMALVTIDGGGDWMGFEDAQTAATEAASAEIAAQQIMNGACQGNNLSGSWVAVCKGAAVVYGEWSGKKNTDDEAIAIAYTIINRAYSGSVFARDYQNSGIVWQDVLVQESDPQQYNALLSARYSAAINYLFAGLGPEPAGLSVAVSAMVYAWNYPINAGYPYTYNFGGFSGSSYNGWTHNCPAGTPVVPIGGSTFMACD